MCRKHNDRYIECIIHSYADFLDPCLPESDREHQYTDSDNNIWDKWKPTQSKWPDEQTFGMFWTSGKFWVSKAISQHGNVSST